MGQIYDSDNDVVTDSDGDAILEDDQPVQIFDNDGTTYMHDSDNSPVFYLPREKRS